MSDQYLDLIKKRHTIYSICSESPISDEKLQDIVVSVVTNTPSSFNCQSTRLMILLREHHVKFWEIAKECFRATMSSAQYQDYEKKLLGRQAGYGTILLCEDMSVIREFQAKFTRFQDHLLDFSEANNAMQAFNLWTALSLEGFGCNLQHINPIIDERMYAEFDVPRSWVLRAQLVFGLPTNGVFHSKTTVPIQDRVMLNGAKVQV